MKKLIALLLVFATIFAFAACGKDNGDDKVTATESAAETTAPADDVTAASQDANVTVAPDSSEAASDPTAASEVSTAPETTVNVAELVAPTATADILTVYNNAVNGAFNARAGFKKTRSTDNEVLDAGVALKAFKSLVYKFIGIGAENQYSETVTKGKWDSDTRRYYLRKSTLTANDLSGATCTLVNGKYTVTLNVKGGNSVASSDKKTTNAPLDKCGICVGNEDKGYYDHKTAEVIYDAIDDTYAGASIQESYNNAKVVAVIDAATGKLEKLSVDFDIKVFIDIGIGKGTATGTSHVRYSDFKY